MHDEDEIYREEVEAARGRATADGGIDMFGFMVSFKGVFLEGMEVVFIVITFGLNADDVPLAAAGAGAAALLVLTIALVLRKPLAMIPENTLKYGVGLMLAAFGTYWAVEGIGVFRDQRESLEWLGDDLALLGLIALWLLVSRVLVRALQVTPAPTTPAPVGAASNEGVPR